MKTSQKDKITLKGLMLHDTMVPTDLVKLSEGSHLLLGTQAGLWLLYRQIAPLQQSPKPITEDSV
jgi:hypothetical protein